MTRSGTAVTLPDDATVGALLDAASSEQRPVVVHRPGRAPDPTIVGALMRAIEAAGSATGSPVPSDHAADAVVYDTHPAAPPPASLPLPCRELCVIDPQALSSVPLEVLGVDRGSTVRDQLVPIAEHLTRHGWRHVTAPGVALRWDPANTAGASADAGWTSDFVRSQAGAANVGLEAHRSWADARLAGARVVIDGACLTDQPFTGTQQLVTEVARWMAELRPGWPVSLAVHRSQLASVRTRLRGTDVAVVERSADVDADVVYRPYQMLYARELPFVMDTGRRGLVGQLDMIGFANAAYHPSDRLAFFARNLQRHMMRTLDGVTFISEFGRDSAFAECPDLDPRRLHVVSCGADPRPPERVAGRPDDLVLEGGFVVALSSTFWHKNRAHAIATWIAMVERHGYRGHLVIAGPEPYFGRSSAAETALIEHLPADLRRRVHLMGHIDDDVKWWLLTNAEVALYPSVVEGFGLVPFEAAAVGTPCLAHAGTAPGELLAGTSALVTSWDPADWAAQAASLVGDAVRSRLVTDEILAVTKEHTWRRCAERTWSAIDHALASPRRASLGEDGPMLAHVGAARVATVPGSAIRFDIARGVPAVRRRVVALARRAGARR